MSAVRYLVMPLVLLTTVTVASAQPGPERIGRAQAVLASALDPALPAIPFDTWIRQVAGSSARYEWADGACAGVREIKNPGIGVCGIVVAELPALALTVGIRVGERWQKEQSDRWETPRLHDAFVDLHNDSLLVERLSDLPRVMKLPPEEWPRREILIPNDGIRCAPGKSLGDDGIICGLTISNPGATSVYARVFTKARPYSDEDVEYVLKLAPGARKTMQVITGRVHENGDFGIGVEVNSRSPYLVHGQRGERLLRPSSTVEILEGFMQSNAGHAPAEQDIVRVRGVLAARSHTLDVPVDSSVTRLVVAIEHDQGVAATLFRPGGAPVTTGDRDVRIGRDRYLEVGRTTVASRTVFTVPAPEAGTWKVELNSTGVPAPASYAVTARGNSPLEFDSFEFVRFQGVFHPGYFPTDDDKPVAGERASAQARISDESLRAAFHMIDESGAILQSVALTYEDPHARNWPVGSVTVPAVPFFVVMQATDRAGGRIQRQYPKLFRPETVRVSFAFDETQIPAIVAGATRRFRFTVTNHGSRPAPLDLNASAFEGKVDDLSPARMSLEPGASATASFALTAPSEAGRLQSIHVRLTATHAADQSAGNGTEFRLEVALPDDVDNDYVKNEDDNCPEFPNDQHDDDRDGIGDPCDPTPWSPVQVRDFHPKKGPPGTLVTISGVAFGETAAENEVTFWHVPAKILRASSTELVVEVPSGASDNSLIVVHAPQGRTGAIEMFVVERSPAGGERKK